ncbi:MAG: ABC transporter ATP-binding protein [Dongiaceae bacterium]
MTAVTTAGIVMEFPAGDSTVRVLHGIDLALPPGELIMLVGPSGCGKTTLLSIIAGILSPTQGSVDVFGTPVTTLRDRDKVRFRRNNIGFIFQQYNLLPALTAAENAAVPLVAGGTPLAKAVARAKEILGSVGLGEHAHKLPRQLSGGQQQRVAVARALVNEPRLLVCDEPTAALDAATGQSVIVTLKQVARHAGRVVLVVTHDNRIFRFADRILEMSDGRVTGMSTDTQRWEAAHA